jgi:MFS transporter, NNP family, nitrate/nitrite transporter
MLCIYIPLVVLAAVCAALFMDNIAQVRNEKRDMRSACRDPHTWIVSFLYIGTFGSFIGFSFAFGQVLPDQFAPHFLSHGKVDPVKVACITFLGPLIGSLIRPAGGWLADRIGGAITTLWNFLAMAAATVIVLLASAHKEAWRSLHPRGMHRRPSTPLLGPGQSGAPAWHARERMPGR